MRKCPDCGTVPTAVSDITGSPSHVLLYWCGNCGVLSYKDSDQQLFFCMPDVTVAKGVNAIFPDSMMVDTAKKDTLTKTH